MRVRRGDADKVTLSGFDGCFGGGGVDVGDRQKENERGRPPSHANGRLVGWIAIRGDCCESN